jgi:hypothetical protein
MRSRRLDFTIAGWRVALIGIGQRGRFGFARRGPNVIEAGLGIVGVIAVRKRRPLILTYDEYPAPKSDRPHGQDQGHE